MRNTNHFKNKKVVVIGFARSGLACANLLYDLGAHVSVTDNLDNEVTRQNILKLRSKEIKIELGKHTLQFVQNNDFAVLSPGVCNDALPVTWAESFRIPVISEIELAWLLCPATVIAITGSNGKTTVTTLVGRMLQKAGKEVFICGNIGNPFSAEVDKMKEGDFVSLEVSSFQLERTRDFKPKISAIINFSPNHLDRYKDMEEYFNAKKRIFMNQDNSDFLVLNREYDVLRDLSKETCSKVIYFDQEEGVNPNQAAVEAIGAILNIDKKVAKEVFSEFKGIEHRLEFVEEINQVAFINDSKATTVDSTYWALKNITRPIILIAGGRDKGVDYKTILDIAKNKVREVILIGEASDKIESAFRGAVSIYKAKTLEEAVRRAYSDAKPRDCVLLSPMCSSFDMFRDYEDRGKQFKKIVHNLYESLAPAQTKAYKQ